jgi:hypothetical protein
MAFRLGSKLIFIQLSILANSCLLLGVEYYQFEGVRCLALVDETGGVYL